jgi:hypothetical protein
VPIAWSSGSGHRSRPAPRNDGLNSNYRYIGREREYRPGQELWCSQQAERLVCSHDPRAGSSRVTRTARYAARRAPR